VQSSQSVQSEQELKRYNGQEDLTTAAEPEKTSSFWDLFSTDQELAASVPLPESAPESARQSVVQQSDQELAASVPLPESAPISTSSSFWSFFSSEETPKETPRVSEQMPETVNSESTKYVESYDFVKGNIDNLKTSSKSVAVKKINDYEYRFNNLKRSPKLNYVTGDLKTLKRELKHHLNHWKNDYPIDISPRAQILFQNITGELLNRGEVGGGNLGNDSYDGLDEICSIM